MGQRTGWTWLAKFVRLLAVLSFACRAQPTDRVQVAKAGPPPAAKVRTAPGLPEPLVATAPTGDDEDRDLERAIYGQDGAFPPLLAFVAAHPGSGWNAAIHTNLGLLYYREGFFSKAIAAYEAAWRDGRDATDLHAATMVDRAVAELAKMHARVGHLEEVDALIAEVSRRPIHGGASELLTGAREGAWTMHHDPGVSYLCGPKALINVMESRRDPPAAVKIVDAARSGQHGFSMEQLSALATRAGLRHRIVHREPGQPVPVPSVINWRVSHYAAVVGKTDDGRYLIKDPTFGGDLQIPEAAIDEEGSGFFLVPTGNARAGKPARAPEPIRLAWRDATPEERRRTFGMGNPAGYLAGAVTQADKDTTAFTTGAPPWSESQSQMPTGQGCPGMCVPGAHAMEVSLNLRDTPVGYAPPVGPPSYISLTYNQREAVEPYGPPSTPVSFNVGPQWTLNVLSYVLDNPTSPGATVSRYVPGGGAVSAYSGYSTTTGAFVPEQLTGAVLTRTPATGMATSYTLTGTDGSQLVYALNDGSTSTSKYRRLFLSAIKDPHGNTLSLNYDTSITPTSDAGADAGTVAKTGPTTLPRLSTLTDPAGTTAMTFTYGSDASPLLVTKITDAFGRSASIAYDSNGRLSSITDVLGITSTVAYDDTHSPARPTFVKQLATPYGNTKFDFGETNSGTDVLNRWLETTDPLGHTERLEFMESAPGIPAADEATAVLPVPAGMPLATQASYYVYRNSFLWNKHIYPQYGTGTGKDYTKAQLIHWLHTNNGNAVAPTIESLRHPLEHRVFYEYTPSQTNSIYEGPPATFVSAPTTIARVLDDGTTQLTSIARNALGRTTSVTDPLGRQSLLTYASNDVDLAQVQQATSASAKSALGTYTYNAQHEPLTYKDASGQTTRYSYNSAGQLQGVTDALGNTRSIVYDALGRASQVLDANNLAVETLTYDDFNRVATRTDAAGYKVAYAYDAFDRVTTVTYPDATTEKYAYTNLDLTSTTDRLGQTTAYAYDANRRLTAVTDALGQVTKYAYYEDGTLQSLTDPNGNVTKWDVDIQGRTTVKHYADGTTESYAYEATTSRLKSKTDALGQVTSYAYNADDTLAGVSYSALASSTAPTAPVSFAYDPIFPRLTSMTDGIGTTTYSYYPITGTAGSGRLQFVASPVAGAPGGAVDIVAYSYDALGRVSSRTVNGSSETASYDALGRLANVSNALDTFKYGYADETARVTSVQSAHGPAVALSYFDAAKNPEQSDLLKQMTYTAPSTGQILSQFGYTYDPTGNVKTFTETHLAPAGGSPDAGSPAGAMGMTLPGPHGSGHGTSTGHGWMGNLQGGGPTTLAFVAVLLATLLLLSLGRRRTWAQRVASALAPLALGLLLMTCGSDTNSSARMNGAGGSPATGAGGSSLGGSGVAGSQGGNSPDGGAPQPGVLKTQVTAYQYDKTNRLLTATIGADESPAPDATPQFGYAYDPAGNPTTAVANGITQNSSYTSTNEIVGGNYDPNGSPKVLNGAHYTWDAANRLSSVTQDTIQTRLQYDGLGRLVRTVGLNDGMTSFDKGYTWSGASRLVEHDNLRPGSPEARTHVENGVLVQGTTYYEVVDQLGSVRALIDAGELIATQYDYDPRGTRSRSSGTVEDDRGFAGLHVASDSAIQFALYRGYAAGLGRWLNRDPSGEANGLNLYTYGSNNPTSAFDDLGLDVVYLNASNAAHGYGHAAFLVGNDTSGWTYYSKDGGPDPASNRRIPFSTLDGFLTDKIADSYNRAVYIATSHDQDSKIKKEADAIYKSKYDFVSNNCGDLVRQSLGAGGISLGSPLVTVPNSQYDTATGLEHAMSVPNLYKKYPPASQ